jgi:hypothetical protein
MTSEELRRLDAEVAAALGWTDLKPGCELFYGHPPAEASDTLRYVPRWSSDIAAAWELVEQLAENPHTHVELSNSLKPKGWNCWIGGGVRVNAPTAPLAICRAILLLRSD